MPVFPPSDASTMASSVVGAQSQGAPAHEQGRREAGDVADRAAADAEHAAVTAEPDGDRPAQDGFTLRHRFERSPGGSTTVRPAGKPFPKRRRVTVSKTATADGSGAAMRSTNRTSVRTPLW